MLSKSNRANIFLLTMPDFSGLQFLFNKFLSYQGLNIFFKILNKHITRMERIRTTAGKKGLTISRKRQNCNRVSKRAP